MIVNHDDVQPLRILYFELGRSLLSQKRYDTAIDSLETALEESGDTPQQWEIYYFLGKAYQASGENILAFRAYLDAATEAPNRANQLVPHAWELLTSTMAVSEANWLLSSWCRILENPSLDEFGKFEITRFLGWVSLYADEYYLALNFFQQFQELQPGNSEVLSELEGVLQKLEQSLGNGFTNKAEQVKAEAWQLKGEILTWQNKHDEAAIAFYEAGRNFYWQREYDPAKVQFRRSLELKTDNVMAYWYLSDDLQIQSYIQTPPYVDSTLIQESLDEWNKGIAISLPGVEDSWVYVVRARIGEQLSRIPSEDSNFRRWESIVYLERALLLNDLDAVCWSDLGRCYRNLGVNLNALHATEQALACKPDNQLVMEDRASILINVGQYDEATQLMEQLRQRFPSPIYDSWKAVICSYRYEYKAGLDLINSAVESYPDDLWYRELQATLYRFDGQLNSARENYQWIWGQRNNSKYHQEKASFASAAYNLFLLDESVESSDLLDEAINLYNTLLDRRDQACSANLQLAVCYLSKGNLSDAERFFSQGLELVTNQRELDHILIDLAYLGKTLLTKQSPFSEAVSSLINRSGGLKARIESKRKSLTQDQRTAISELQEVLEYESKGQTGGWPWLAIQAGLGRLYLKEHQWQQATQIYQLLQDYANEFPEARVGLQKVADSLSNQGLKWLQEGRFEEAHNMWLEAISLEILSPKALGDQHVYLGSATIGQNHLEQAQEYFDRAIELYRDRQIPNSGEALGKACSEAIFNIDHYWQVDAAFARLAETNVGETTTNQDFIAARQSLNGYLTKRYQLSEQSGDSVNYYTGVTPIAIEIGQNLIPEGMSSEWQLFKTYIPEMRERLLREMGVQVPGVRVRGNDTDMSRSAYLIMLDEVPLVVGNLNTNQHFCPAPSETLQALGIPASELLPSNQPGTGAPGCWVSPDHKNLIAEHGLELWEDPLLYMVHHLEAILRQNLADFLGVQDVANLLEDWSRQEGGASLIASTLPNDTARLRFGRVLRALLAEQVSIAPWRKILEAVREVGLPQDDVHEAICFVRQHLRPYLPGNNPRVERQSIPESVEQEISHWLGSENDKLFLAIPPEDTQNLLSEVREFVQPYDHNLVLVTQDTRVRPFVRQLIELEFLQIMAISKVEILSVEEIEAGHRSLA